MSPGRDNYWQQTSEINFESSAAYRFVAISFILLHFLSIVPSFVLAVLLKCSFAVSSTYFCYISLNFGGHFLFSKFGQNPWHSSFANATFPVLSFALLCKLQCKYLFFSYLQQKKCLLLCPFLRGCCSLQERKASTRYNCLF